MIHITPRDWGITMSLDDIAADVGTVEEEQQEDDFCRYGDETDDLEPHYDDLQDEYDGGL